MSEPVKVCKYCNYARTETEKTLCEYVNGGRDYCIAHLNARQALERFTIVNKPQSQTAKE